MGADFSVEQIERFDARVFPLENGCWYWTGWKIKYGYGRLWVKRKPWLAHRFSYTITKGPIPEGLSLDHLCRNPSCVNPSHLEAVTHAENVKRGKSGQFQKNKTHCPHGHQYTVGNTGVYGGRRQCMTCNRNRAYARWVRIRYV